MISKLLYPGVTGVRLSMTPTELVEYRKRQEEERRKRLRPVDEIIAAAKARLATGQWRIDYQRERERASREWLQTPAGQMYLQRMGGEAGTDTGEDHTSSA